MTAMEAVTSRFGRIDALLNIAGGFRWIKIEDSHSADLEFLLRMNVQTTANAARAALPAITESPAGRIVNVGALAAEKATAGMGPYSASKAAVLRQQRENGQSERRGLKLTFAVRQFRGLEAPA